MNQPMKATETAPAPVANAQPTRVITNPREIAAIVMAQMDVVNAKKDELAKAAKALTDMTQQLVIAYAQQARFIERLVQRAKALKGQPNGTDPKQMAA